MNWTKVKSPAEIQLPGLDVQVDRVDGNVHAVVFSAGGKSVRCVYSGYSIEVQVPTPPKLVKKFRVTGNVLDLKVDTLLDSGDDPKEYIRHWKENTSGDISLKSEEVEVPESV